MNGLKAYHEKLKVLLNGKAPFKHDHDYSDRYAEKNHDHNEEYYQKSEIDVVLDAKASSVHEHTTKDITDFPKKLPASDVSDWAKRKDKPSYSWNEINNKPLAFTPESHSHDNRYYTKEEVNKLMNTYQVSGILKAGASTITLTHEKITSESMIDIYTSIYGINPKTVDITDGSITLTFKEQSDDIQIKVVIS